MYPPGATTSGFILPSVVGPPELHFSRCSHIWVTWFTGPEIANFVEGFIVDQRVQQVAIFFGYRYHRDAHFLGRSPLHYHKTTWFVVRHDDNERSSRLCV